MSELPGSGNHLVDAKDDEEKEERLRKKKEQKEKQRELTDEKI